MNTKEQLIVRRLFVGNLLRKQLDSRAESVVFNLSLYLKHFKWCCAVPMFPAYNYDAKKVPYFYYLKGGRLCATTISVARGPKGPFPPKFQVCSVVLCFGTRFPKPHAVARLNSKYFPTNSGQGWGYLTGRSLQQLFGNACWLVSTANNIATMPNVYIVTVSNIYIVKMPKCNHTNQPKRYYIINKLTQFLECCASQ